MASPETVPRDLDETTVTIIQDTPERRLAVLGEIDEAYGRDVRAGATTPPAPKRGLDDHDSEVARALLRGKHGVEDDPHRTVSPTDVTADVYAAA